MTEVLMRRGKHQVKTETQKKLCEDGGKDWSVAAISPGHPHQVGEAGRMPSRALTGAQPRPTLTAGPWPLRLCEETCCCFKLPSV